MKKIFILAAIMTSFLLYEDVDASENIEQKLSDESIYYIMVDRFMNENYENDSNVIDNDLNSYQGGDLAGIIEKLDYIKNMGFTTIQLTPIMENGPNSYDGYSVTDFQSVDEHFGTMADARKLVKEAHKRDMKVIFDFVVNSTGTNHPWLEDQKKEDWYQSDSTTLNLKNDNVKQYIFETAGYWINETGADGFGLNVDPTIPEEFWADFSDYVKAMDKDFIMLGKVKTESPDYHSAFDLVVGDSFADRATEVFKQAGKSPESVFNLLEQKKDLSQLGTYFDNPDTQRFTRLSLESKGNPVTRWKLGLTYMFTTPGIPIVYYGSEVPLDGGPVPDNRRLMNFKSGDDQLSKRIEKLNALREQYPALTQGEMEKLYSKDGFIIYKRSLNDQILVIALNNAPATKTAEITGLPQGKQLRGTLIDGMVFEQEPGTYQITLDREQADIFIVEPETGLNWIFITFVLGILGLFIFGVSFTGIKNKKKSRQPV